MREDTMHRTHARRPKDAWQPPKIHGGKVQISTQPPRMASQRVKKKTWSGLLKTWFALKLSRIRLINNGFVVRNSGSVSFLTQTQFEFIIFFDGLVILKVSSVFLSRTNLSGQRLRHYLSRMRQGKKMQIWRKRSKNSPFHQWNNGLTS